MDQKHFTPENMPVQSQKATTDASGITRRRFLETSVVTAAAIASSSVRSLADKPDWAAQVPRSETCLDEGWLFRLGDHPGSENPSIDDNAWRKLDLPHDWRIEDLPNQPPSDGHETSDPSVFAAFRGEDVPSRVGPFDSKADAVPDMDLTFPGFGHILMPGGRSQGYTVAGIGWYRKHLTVPKVPGHDNQQVELRFDGVYRNCDVWLNGVHLGFHPNGYTSFSYDLTSHLTPGENVLAVRVDNRGKSGRWYSGSGIYRHTWLTVTGTTRVALWGVQVTTPQVSAQGSTANIKVTIKSTKFADAGVRLTIFDAQGHSVATSNVPAKQIEAGAQNIFEAVVPIPKTALWSPEAPHLYKLQTEVLVGGRVVDVVSTAFGVRSLVFNGTNGLLLNGKSYKLHGGNLHHDHGPLGSAAFDRAEERTVEVMKAAGFNSIRASHNPRSPYFLEVCDRLGMLVYNEFTDVWDVKKTEDDYHLYFVDWWERDLTSMVMRDRNHASVILWSIGNEIFEDPNHYGKRLANHVRSLDGSRPVALGGMNIGNVPDAWDYVDVGDLHGTPKQSDHDAHPDKAFIQSENLVTTMYPDWKLEQDAPWFVGSLVWAGWDYIGEAGGGPAVLGRSETEFAKLEVAYGPVLGKVPYPWFNSFMSDLDMIGQRKPQNYLRAVINGTSPLEVMVLRPAPDGLQQFAVAYGFYDELPSWTWEVQPNELMTVHAYNAGDSVSVVLNGKQIETKAVSQADMRIATFHVPYAPGELTVIAKKGGKEIGRKSLVTAGRPKSLRLTSDVKTLTGRNSLAHVLVEVLDEQGRLVPDAVANVRFDVSGSGTLIGVANGNPHNLDSFKQPHRWTWHGKALAILQPAKVRGRVSLTVSAASLQPATLILPVTLNATS